MSQRIVIRVAPNGETEVRTEGFNGRSCQQASELIERALGHQLTERLTEDFYKASTDVGHNHLQQGESS